MVNFVGEARSEADERTLGLLWKLAADEMSPADVAAELFAKADESAGAISEDALHIAAETTTDDDLELARHLWLALLFRSTTEIVTRATAEVMTERWDVVDRPTTITTAMSVPAAAP